MSEYQGETNLVIHCTQLDDPSLSQKERKRIVMEWCDFLKSNPTQFTELTFGTRMPQELFDAVCHQENLTRLNIKWGVYKDISAIANLQKLNLLHIGSGAGVESIVPITQLKNLVGLSVENFRKIPDYSPLSSMKGLESLSIEGDGLGPQYIQLDSLEFLKDLSQLRFFRLLTARLKSKDYTPVLALRNVEHLSLRSERNVKKIYEELVALPKLKWGLLKERPENYQKK
ncbi:hypothetical protein AAG747_27560 [Rapidithrix thailandica]|uniref:Leucine-rich repeat domain-containing protein n=1 Tax=Rapidithrix thailandica TaxID=413964 RepID=A0AAW9SHA8_9BACT